MRWLICPPKPTLTPERELEYSVKLEEQGENLYIRHSIEGWCDNKTVARIFSKSIEDHFLISVIDYNHERFMGGFDEETIDIAHGKEEAKEKALTFARNYCQQLLDKHSHFKKASFIDKTKK